MAYLLILEGLDSGKTYNLLPYNTLGISKGNTIILQDRRFSFSEICIEKEASAYKISNLKTPSSKIKINGKIIQESFLQHGDIIVLQNYTMLFLEHKDDIPKFEKGLSQLKTPPKDSPVHILHWATPQILPKESSQDKRQLLIEVSIAIATIHERNILLKRILSIICKAFPIDRAFIILIKPKSYKIEVSPKNAKVKKDNLDYSKTITRKVFRRKISMICNPSEHQSYSDISCLSMPLNCKGEFLGLIQIESFSGHKFTHENLDEMRKVAIQTAMAIENLATHQQPVRYREHLISLEKFSLSLSRHLNKEVIFQEGVKAALSLFRSKRVSILLADKDKKYLRIACAEGIDKEEWDNMKILIEDSIAGQVFQKNKALLVKNSRKILEEFHAKKDWRGKYNSCSFILAPIQVIKYREIIQNEAIGVICVTDKEDSENFEILERNLLMLLANQIGIAITNAGLYEKATIDPMTHIYTRGYFFQRLQEEVFLAQKSSTSLSLLLFDLDHFKSVNDTYSHYAGDRVLEQMGKLLMKAVHRQEVLGRYGGEEFVILLKANQMHAKTRALEIQNLIRNHHFIIKKDKTLQMTSSMGISTLHSTDTPHLLIERADQSLYLAKRKGRNCIITEDQLTN